MVENVAQIKYGITINISVSAKIRKKIICVKIKKHIWNPATCTCENDKYSGSIIDNSVITCDRIIEATKTVPTKSTSTDIYILLVIWLITIALLIAVSISCYLIKYRSK